MPVPAPIPVPAPRPASGASWWWAVAAAVPLGAFAWIFVQGILDKPQPSRNAAQATVVTPAPRPQASASQPTPADAPLDSGSALQVLFGNFDRARGAAVWTPKQPVPAEFGEWKGRALVKAVQSEVYQEGGVQKALLITSAVPDKGSHDCHACGVLLGGAVLVRDGAGWQIVSHKPFLTEAGSWGTLNAKGVRVAIGPSTSGLLFRGGYTSMGDTEEHAFIVAPIGDVPRYLGSFATGYNNGGRCEPKAATADLRCYGYSSELSFVRRPDGRFFDLAVKYSGTEPVENRIERVSRTDVYALDGFRYVKQGAAGATIPTANQAAQPSSAAGEIDERARALVAAAASGDEARFDALRADIDAAPKPARGDRSLAREFHKRALELIREDRYPEGAAALEGALTADPGDVEVRGDLGYAYLKAGRLQDAEKILVGTLALAPARANSWANLGQVYAMQGDEKRAMACFRNTIRFSRSPEKTREFLANLAESDPNPSMRSAAAAAVAPLSGRAPAVQSNPGVSTNALEGMVTDTLAHGERCFEAKRFDCAITSATTVLRLSPENQQALRLQARAEQEQRAALARIKVE